MEVSYAHAKEDIAGRINVHTVDLALIDEEHDVNYILLTLKYMCMQYSAIPIVLVRSACSDIEAVVSIMEKSVTSYISYTKTLQQLRAYLLFCLHKYAPRHVRYAHENAQPLKHDKMLIGASNEMRRIRSFIAQSASTNASVMLFGESGTGKNLIAHLIHLNSSRSDNNFQAVNCAAIPDTLAESEFFGSEVGAFTGAIARKGVFTLSHNGTLFLDEVTDLSPFSQSKLLHAIDQQKYIPLGSERECKVDIRFISATNKNIHTLISHQEFRSDLYYRMAILYYTIAPLRERLEDIMPLALHFLHAENSDAYFSIHATDKIISHSWPGNIRELRNCMIRASALSSGNKVRDKDIVFDPNMHTLQ